MMWRRSLQLLLGATLMAGLCPGLASAQAAAASPPDAPPPPTPVSSPPPVPNLNATGGEKLTICVANYSPVPISLCNNATDTTAGEFCGPSVGTAPANPPGLPALCVEVPRTPIPRHLWPPCPLLQPTSRGMTWRCCALRLGGWG